MTATDETTYLIIGAGVTGLSFAGALKRDDYLVVEAEDAIGGYCRTIKRAGFTWDYSGHFFHFRHPEIEAELVNRMGDQKILKVAKDSRIHFKGKLVDFPFQKNIHQLPQPDFIECLHDLYFRQEGKVANFKEMLYSKFGAAISDKFLIPYNEKLYATDLATLDTDAMGRFFPYADIDEIIKNFRNKDNVSYNSTFTYPEGGAIQYVEAINQDVNQDNICLGERVTRIDRQARIAYTSAARAIRYQYLISSAPFDKLLELADVARNPAIYSCNQVEVFNIGFDRKGPESVHWIYYPDRELSFYRLGFYDNIFGSDRMSMYVEIGRASHEVIPSEEESLSRIVSDLKRVGIVTNHEIVAHARVILNPAYVHITQDSIADVAEKRAALKKEGIYSAGRYGAWTYCSIEDNIIEARTLASELA